MEDQTIEKVFPAGEHPAIKLSNIAGKVIITGSPISEIRVEARKHNNGDVESTIINMNQQEDGCVVIKVEHEQGLLDGLLLRRLCSVDFDIQAPQNCIVEASVISADLEAFNLESDLKFNSVSGEMDLENLRGDLSISTVSGEVEASGLHGNLHIKTVSGDVSMEDSNLVDLKLSTVSADVSLDSAVHLEGSYHLSSVSGDIDWDIPEDTSCRFHSSTISGGIYIETMGGKQRMKGRKYQTLTLGSGGPDIHLSSVSGDLRIRSALAVPTMS